MPTEDLGDTMPYQATVFNVMIASPSDVGIERNLVREVVQEWNAVHSKSRGIVLQPVGWETHSHPSMEDRAQGVLNRQILADADLLVAVFWTRVGTATGVAVSGTVEEIERHLQRGRDAMIYFSSEPVRPDSVDDEQYRRLKEFKQECRKRGLVEDYESPTEFRQMFVRHLASKINGSSQFSSVGNAAEFELTIPDRNVPNLTTEARALLLEAVKDQHGQILNLRLVGEDEVSTNGKQFIEEANPRSRAKWAGAVEELVSLGLIRDVGHKGEIFEVTREGYDMAELLGSL